MPWSQCFCASDEKTQLWISEWLPGAKAWVRFHLFSCQDVAFRAWAADENVNNAPIKRKMLFPLAKSTDIPIDQWWSEVPFAGQRERTHLPYPIKRSNVFLFQRGWMRRKVETGGILFLPQGSLEEVGVLSPSHIPSLTGSNGNLGARFRIWPPSSHIPKGNQLDQSQTPKSQTMGGLTRGRFTFLWV